MVNPWMSTDLMNEGRNADFLPSEGLCGVAAQWPSSRALGRVRARAPGGTALGRAQPLEPFKYCPIHSGEFSSFLLGRHPPFLHGHSCAEGIGAGRASRGYVHAVPSPDTPATCQRKGRSLPQQHIPGRCRSCLVSNRAAVRSLHYLSAL